MNMRIKWMVMFSLLAAGNVFGAFAAPTQDQLQAAAKEPVLVVALLKDASVPQAAEVAKDVIVQIVNLDLEPEQRDARIAEIVRHLFLSWPEDKWDSLAIALGRAVASSPTASMNPAVVSASQRAVIAVAALAAGNAFGNAFNLAMQTVAGAPGGGKNVPPPTPPPPMKLPPMAQPPRPPPRPPRPPVAPPYQAQRFP